MDYKDNFKRYPKASAKWYKDFISSHGGGRVNNNEDDSVTGPAAAGGRVKPVPAAPHDTKHDTTNKPPKNPASHTTAHDHPKHDTKPQKGDHAKKDDPKNQERATESTPIITTNTATNHPSGSFTSNITLLVGMVGALAAVVLVAAFFVGRTFYRRSKYPESQPLPFHHALRYLLR